jgi:hypothetical protein
MWASSADAAECFPRTRESDEIYRCSVSALKGGSNKLLAKGFCALQLIFDGAVNLC